MKGVVLSCLFTTMPDPIAALDPGRPEYWPADSSIGDPLLDSLEGQEVRIFHDGVSTDDPRWIKVPVGATNAYWQRWFTYRDWLEDHPEVEAVWCVDLGDVRCLAPDRLWHLAPNVLYTGYEPEVLGCGWMLDNHPASREWLEKNQDQVLLNAGVVGGERQPMIRFLDAFLSLWARAKVMGQEDTTDMALFARAAREVPYLTGPRVVTEFRKYDYDNTESLWAHK